MQEISSLPDALDRIYGAVGEKFIIIIDEWDAPVRERPETGKGYFEFLRTLFKSSGTTDRIFAAVYMTGICL